MYKAAHEKIRQDPSPAKHEPREVAAKPKRWNRKKITLSQRKAHVKQRKEAFLRQHGGNDDKEEEEE